MKILIQQLLCLSAILVIFTGCEKILEVKPRSSITEQVYFQNEGDFEPYLTGIYTQMRAISGNVTYGTERSEELISASNSRFTVAWSQILSPTSGAVNYDTYYRAIGHCNLLLARIKDVEFIVNPSSKNRIIAETYALRAFFYFHLTRIIKDAPLMLKAVVDENVELLPRSPAPAVVAQVITDLDSAALMLKTNPSFSPASYPSKYRFAYGSVMAMKADVKIWSGKVLGGGTAAFNDAITAINEVEATGVTLNDDFKNVVGLRASSNPEAILYSYHNRDETGNNYTMQALPFLALITGALNLDSLPYSATATNAGGAFQISPKSRALFSAYPNDKRIPHTWVTERQSTGPKISWITKFPGTKYPEDRVPDNDLPIYRLADILLLKAEAYAALNNTALAIQNIDKVRVRTGNGPYTGPTDKATVEKEILDERGRELFFENKRWYDLVRFHYGGTINVYTYVPNLVGKTTPLFWPLNTTVLANNKLVTQTEGY
jgi:hypothetical protein